MEGKRGMRRRRRAFKNIFFISFSGDARAREGKWHEIRVEGGFFPHHFRCKVATSGEIGYSAGGFFFSRVRLGTGKRCGSLACNLIFEEGEEGQSSYPRAQVNRRHDQGTFRIISYLVIHKS